LTEDPPEVTSARTMTNFRHVNRSYTLWHFPQGLCVIYLPTFSGDSKLLEFLYIYGSSSNHKVIRQATCALESDKKIKL